MVSKGPQISNLIQTLQNSTNDDQRTGKLYQLRLIDPIERLSMLVSKFYNPSKKSVTVLV